MDLTARIRRAAFSRPHPLLVVAPESIETRLAVERYVRQRGWPAAESAADADVLVVLGSVEESLESVVRVLETQIPAPWIRVDIQHAHQVNGQLDGVPLRLAQWPTGARPSRPEVNPDRSAKPPEDGERVTSDRAERHGDQAEHHEHEEGAPHRKQPAAASEGRRIGDDDRGHQNRAEAAHGGRDMSGDPDGDMPAQGNHGMVGHEGHDVAGHGGHDMAGHGEHVGSVAGLPMASRAPDRDGLKLDVLHIPFGPVLPYWPAGLRLRLTVQGDVVQEAMVERLGISGAGPSFWDEPVLRLLAGRPVDVAQVARRRAAAHLDSTVRLLGVAGWDAAACASAILRDRVLDGESSGHLRRDFDRLRNRVLRSRTLRRMTCGLGVLDGATANRLGVSGPAASAAGDVFDRLCRWLRSTADDLGRLDDGSPSADVEGPRGRLDGEDPPSAALLEALPPMVVGAELAGVRLVVASLDPDLAELAHAPEAVGRG